MCTLVRKITANSSFFCLPATKIDKVSMKCLFIYLANQPTHKNANLKCTLICSFKFQVSSLRETLVDRFIFSHILSLITNNKTKSKKKKCSEIQDICQKQGYYSVYSQKNESVFSLV